MRSAPARRSWPSWPSSSTPWPTGSRRASRSSAATATVAATSSPTSPTNSGRHSPRCGCSTSSSRAAQRGSRDSRRIPRVERPADRAPRLACPEPAGALEAGLRDRAARSAARRPPGGGRERGRTDGGRRDAPRGRRLASDAAAARPHPPRPATDRSGRRQPRRERGEVHADGAVRSRSTSPRRPKGPGSRWPTPASGSTPRSCRTSSSASTEAHGPTRRVAAAAVSASRSFARSWTCMAGRSASRARSGSARGSSWTCPATPGWWPGRRRLSTPMSHPRPTRRLAERPIRCLDRWSLLHRRPDRRRPRSCPRLRRSRTCRKLHPPSARR